MAGVVPLVAQKDGVGVASYNPMGKARARNTTQGSLLMAQEARGPSVRSGSPLKQRRDWPGRARFAGQISRHNILGKKPHSSALVDSGVAFGDNQSVIGVAEERRGQQLRWRLVTPLLELLYCESPTA